MPPLITIEPVARTVATRASENAELGVPLTLGRLEPDTELCLVELGMRGTGQSDGCMRYGDEVDWRDGAAVVQAIAAQPWSNGNVGMWGHSYPAWSQMMTAAMRPPALKAIVPTSGVYDLWSLLTRRGAPLTGGLGSAFAPAFTLTTGHQPPQGVKQLCPELVEHYNAHLKLNLTEAEVKDLVEYLKSL